MPLGWKLRSKYNPFYINLVLFPYCYVYMHLHERVRPRDSNGTRYGPIPFRKLLSLPFSIAALPSHGYIRKVDCTAPQTYILVCIYTCIHTGLTGTTLEKREKFVDLPPLFAILTLINWSAILVCNTIFSLSFPLYICWALLRDMGENLFIKTRSGIWFPIFFFFTVHQFHSRFIYLSFQSFAQMFEESHPKLRTLIQW